MMMMMMMDCEPSLPQPPHVSVLVGEEAVGVIAAVLQVTEAAAEKCRGVTVRPRTREALHEHVFFAVVTLAVRAHVRRAVSRTWTRQDAWRPALIPPISRCSTHPHTAVWECVCVCVCVWRWSCCWDSLHLHQPWHTSLPLSLSPSLSLSHTHTHTHLQGKYINTLSVCTVTFICRNQPDRAAPSTSAGTTGAKKYWLLLVVQVQDHYIDYLYCDLTLSGSNVFTLLYKSDQSST